jgi:aldehyde dehydrogenase (NAD+)
MDFADMVGRQRAFFETGATRAPGFRREQLQKLSAALERHESRLLAALQADLRKSPFQGYASELGLLQVEIRHAVKNLSRWTARRRGRTPWFIAPARGWVQPEPFGVALILGPWNYPVQLLLLPLAGAMAAGNCAVLKPSELAPHTAAAIAALVKETFPEHFVAVVNGGAEAAEALLRERFDKIFFTGSTRVGRAVMAAAAKQLTSVTLELGGKCPVIVCADAAIEQAARRIAWGKFMNAGQTCVAPDFVLVQHGVREAFVSALKKALREFYGEDARQSAAYGRIVNARHFARLVNYLGDGKIIHGGEHEAADLFLGPTLLAGVPPEAPAMQEEIFGPILPIQEFDGLEDALAQLRGRPAPLALYVFTRDRATQARVLAETRSGGVCLNDVVAHMIGTGLPFGGLGESGLGAYHGWAGFDTFSHARSVVRRATWLDLPFRYPPERLSLRNLKRAMRFLLGD